MVFWESLFWCKSLELALAEWKKFINLYKSMANHLIFSTVDTYTLGSGHEFLHFFLSKPASHLVPRIAGLGCSLCRLDLCRFRSVPPLVPGCNEEFLRFPGHVTDQMPSNQPANRGGLSRFHLEFRHFSDKKNCPLLVQ